MMQDTNRNIIRSVVVFGFLALNLLTILILSSVYFYFNTGAEKNVLIKDPAQENQLFQIQYPWKYETENKRVYYPEGLIKLQTDYLRNFYVHNTNKSSSSTEEWKEFYGDSLTKNVEDNLNHQLYSDMSVEQVGISHHPIIHHYSVDGRFVSITDSAVLEYNRVYHQEEIIDEYFEQSDYKVILNLINGYWKFHHIVKENSHRISYFQKSSPKKISLSPIIGTNYYPQHHPWEEYWLTMPIDSIQKDFQLMHDAGLNTIRIFIPYKDFIYPPELKRLQDVLDVMQQENMQAVVTLFDFFGEYSTSQWPLTQVYIQTIVESLKDHPALLMWDVKNEPDLDYTNFGKDDVDAWLQFALTEIRNTDPKTPCTIGWSHPEKAQELVDFVDVVSFHYYLSPSDFVNHYQNLDKKANGKPIVLQEFGTHSYNAFWFPFSHTENQQMEYYQDMFTEIEKTNLKNFIHWTFFDFPTVPDKVVGGLPWRKNPQQKFGFIDTEGNIKPAYNWISGTHTSTVPISTQINAFYISCIVGLSILLLLIALLWKVLKNKNINIRQILKKK